VTQPKCWCDKLNVRLSFYELNVFTTNIFNVIYLLVNEKQCECGCETTAPHSMWLSHDLKEYLSFLSPLVPGSFLQSCPNTSTFCFVSKKFIQTHFKPYLSARLHSTLPNLRQRSNILYIARLQGSPITFKVYQNSFLWLNSPSLVKTSFYNVIQTPNSPQNKSNVCILWLSNYKLKWKFHSRNNKKNVPEINKQLFYAPP